MDRDSKLDSKLFAVDRDGKRGANFEAKSVDVGGGIGGGFGG
jgi:hypothetical protein